VSGDAYVSIRHARTRVFDEPGGDAVVLVDLERADDLEVLRNIDSTVLRRDRAPMLIRTELGLQSRDEFIASAAIIFERWGLNQPLVLLEHPVGSEPTLTHIHGEPILAGDEQRLLRHARLVELLALLEWGRAIWRPATYHYLLPSGEHAGEYIRFADAIREPRDAQVLASWLNRSLSDDTGFVIDSSPLNPVVLAVLRTMEAAELRANPVAVLDQYPRSSADIDAAIDLAAGMEGKVLALLSVSSSGAVLSRLYTALESKRSTLKSARLEVMIRKSSSALPDSVEVWSPLAGESPLVGEGAVDTTCELCRSSKRARICPISPRTLDEMLPSQLRMTMPSAAGALANRHYWEIADACEAVRVEAHPHPAVGFHRRSQISMPIAVRLEEMLGDADLPKRFRERVELLREEGLDPDPDLVLAPEHELEFDGYEDFWAQVRDSLAPNCERPLTFPGDDQNLSPEVREAVRGAERILVFCLGAVTGVLLQRGLVAVQGAREDRDFVVQGLVVHARPATNREWQGLTNGYGFTSEGERRLFATWTTLLPDRSPLRDELALLEGLDESELDPDLIDFREERVRLCGGGSGSERPPLFWGSRPDDVLTPNAIFGEHLSARAAYAAVGAAMEQARAVKAEDASPEYRVFELPAIFRSYYDPLLVASLLRWLRPHEAWWGWQWQDCERVVTHLISRMPLELRRILIPELLLAAAQGKVGPSAISTLQEFAKDLLPVLQGNEKAALRLGLLMAPAPPGGKGPAGAAK
jgi:hypothetical protein